MPPDQTIVPGILIEVRYQVYLYPFVFLGDDRLILYHGFDESRVVEAGQLGIVISAGLRQPEGDQTYVYVVSPNVSGWLESKFCR